MSTIYTDKDCNKKLLQRKKIAIIGYGSQGHAHALNLRDDGAAHLKIGLRENSVSATSARAQKLEVGSIEACAQWADVVMLLTPDESQADIYNQHLAPHMKKGASLAFAHGFNIHFGYLTPREDLDVWMVAPKEIGPVVRSTYVAGGGVPSLLAIAQNATGQAQETALAYAAGIGAGRAGILTTSFAQECEVDLFGEQAVLFGGLPPLMHAAFEVLVEGGYSPEMAYFKCVQQVKLVADAVYNQGISAMQSRISNTAEYGGYVAKNRLITPAVKQEMKALLAEIQSGAFARDFIENPQTTKKTLENGRIQLAKHPMEETGKTIRELAGVTDN